jgi:hypothetical protein
VASVAQARMLVLPGGCRRCVGVSPTPWPVPALRPSAVNIGRHARDVLVQEDSAEQSADLDAPRAAISSSAWDSCSTVSSAIPNARSRTAARSSRSAALSWSVGGGAVRESRAGRALSVRAGATRASLTAAPARARPAAAEPLGPACHRRAPDSRSRRIRLRRRTARSFAIEHPPVAECGRGYALQETPGRATGRRRAGPRWAVAAASVVTGADHGHLGHTLERGDPPGAAACRWQFDRGRPARSAAPRGANVSGWVSRGCCCQHHRAGREVAVGGGPSRRHGSGPLLGLGGRRAAFLSAAAWLGSRSVRVAVSTGLGPPAHRRDRSEEVEWGTTVPLPSSNPGWWALLLRSGRYRVFTSHGARWLARSVFGPAPDHGPLVPTSGGSRGRALVRY